jgi:hypothetical protein
MAGDGGGRHRPVTGGALVYWHYACRSQPGADWPWRRAGHRAPVGRCNPMRQWGDVAGHRRGRDRQVSAGGRGDRARCPGRRECPDRADGAERGYWLTSSPCSAMTGAEMAAVLLRRGGPAPRSRSRPTTRLRCSMHSGWPPLRSSARAAARYSRWACWPAIRRRYAARSCMNRRCMRCSTTPRGWRTRLRRSSAKARRPGASCGA